MSLNDLRVQIPHPQDPTWKPPDSYRRATVSDLVDALKEEGAETIRWCAEHNHPSSRDMNEDIRFSTSSPTPCRWVEKLIFSLS